MKRQVTAASIATLLFAAGAIAAPVDRVLRTTIELAAPVDQVWALWTTEAGLTSFFAPGARVEPRVEGPYEIYFNPAAPPGQRGADGMQILVFQPSRRLAFTWNAPPSLPQAREQRTFVVIRFQPVSERETRVTLHHTGWGDGGEWDKAYAYFDRAWGNVLGNLKKSFETGPFDWTAWLEQMRKATPKN